MWKIAWKYNRRTWLRMNRYYNSRVRKIRYKYLKRESEMALFLFCGKSYIFLLTNIDDEGGNKYA